MPVTRPTQVRCLPLKGMSQVSMNSEIRDYEAISMIESTSVLDPHIFISPSWPFPSHYSGQISKHIYGLDYSP